MVKYFFSKHILWSFGVFYPRVKITSWVILFPFARKARLVENYGFYAYIGSGTTLSQVDRSGATKCAQKMNDLEKIMFLKVDYVS